MFETLPQISLGTAAIFIFAACLAYLLLRGITRLLIATGIFAVSVLFGFFTWQQAPELSIEWFNRSIGLITTGLPVVVFFATFIILRLALRWITSPFGGPPEPKQENTGKIPVFKMTFLLAIALIPTFIVMIIAIGVIHHTASITEVRDYADQNEESSAPFLQKLKQSIEATLPAPLLKTIDPYAEQSRIALVKWVTRQSSPDPEPVIDPATGEPIPRAIIVKDPELQELARKQKFGTLLRHPVITKALDDPKIRSLVDDL